MSWTNGQPSPAEYAMRELRARPLYEVLDPDHARRVIKRSAPLLSRVLTGVEDDKLPFPSYLLAHDLMVKMGSLDVQLWSNNTFTIARLGADLASGREAYGVATRMETDRPDTDVAIRLATARALHSLLLQIIDHVAEYQDVEAAEAELQSLGV